MMEAHFVLTKSKLLNQINILENLGLKVSYSYKTNRQVGDILQKEKLSVDFSIHAYEEIEMIKNKSKISFFIQAESIEELKGILKSGVTTFVIDNEVDLERILQSIKEVNMKINLSLRMKFLEHRVGSGKYFVYGISARKVNELILKLKDNELIEKLGVHIHRKSQNTSEWEIKNEIEDSLSLEALKRVNLINIGGGLPSIYRSSTINVFPYIFKKLVATCEFLKIHNIETIIEPGRFIAAPCIELNVEIIQIQKNNLIVNTTMYNCAMDSFITGTKMLLKQELSDDNNCKDFYLIKGNSPTRDDIFRYKVKLKDPKVGDILTFINAGAYNYTTDFFGYKKLKTKIIN